MKIATCLQLAGFVLVFLTCACKHSSSISTTKDYLSYDVHGLPDYRCWSGKLDGLQDQLVFCSKVADMWDPPTRRLTGPVVALKAEQFYNQVKAYLPAVKSEEEQRAKNEFEEKWRVEFRDLRKLQADLTKAIEGLALLNGSLAVLKRDSLPGTEDASVAVLQSVIDSRTKSIESIKTDIASLQAKIPAVDPALPQSESGHGNEVVDILKKIIDMKGTIGSDDLGENYNQMKVAIQKTIDLGAPVELLWHWIARKENKIADDFINIPRTTKMSGDYLLLTRIKAPESFKEGDWALNIVFGDIVRREIKSNTGKLKPGEDRPLNLLIPLSDKDKAGQPSCVDDEPSVFLMSCVWLDGCNVKRASAGLKKPTYFSKFSFFRIFQRSPRDFDFEGIHFCIE